MQRAIATSMAGLILGWASIISYPGYKPYVSGYKPCPSTTGYKPYVSVPGYKPYYPCSSSSSSRSSSSSSRKPIQTWDCESNGWLLPNLLGRDPLSFCHQIPVNAPGTMGSDWLSL